MIEEVKLKLYSDPELTQVEAEFIASGTTSPQTIPMSGLDSATRYYAVAYATDNNGVTGASQPLSFRTLEAAVTVEGMVRYGITYDVLQYDVNYTDGDNYTFVAKGVEFSTQMDFHSDVQTFVYPSGAVNWQEASPFEAHTLYYYRFFAEFEEIGRVYGQPEQNTITTMYAMPVFTIITDSVGENDAQITISYTGDYPIDYNSLQGSVVGGTGDVMTLQLDALTPEHPETITLSGLDPSTLYEVEVWMRYYDTYAEAYSSFTTAESTVHNYDIRISPTWNVDYHIIDFDVTATQIAFGRFTVTNIGIDICAVPDFSGHQLGGELGSGALTFTWEATGLNEHRRYYCRPWIETLEYGREYGETKIVESHWDIPDVVIEQSDEGWDSVLLNVKYAGGLPVPSNGVIKIYSADMQTLVRTVSASDLVWNGSKQILVTGLQTHTTYNAVYEGAYYSFGNLVTATSEIHTSAQRMVIERTDSWAQNGQHTDVITVHIGLGDSIDDANFLYPLGITIVSQTVEDNVYTIVTEGYRYGNPYQFSAEVILEDDYRQSETFGITVPTQNLTGRSVHGLHTDALAIADAIGVFVDVVDDVWFDLDWQNTTVEMVKSGSTFTYNCSRVYQFEPTVKELTFFFDTLEGGQYTVNSTITNVFGQSVTTSRAGIFVLQEMKVIPQITEIDGEPAVTATISWNRYYTQSYPTKSVQLKGTNQGVTAGTVSVTPTTIPQQPLPDDPWTQYVAEKYVGEVQFTNLPSGIAYQLWITFVNPNSWKVYNAGTTPGIQPFYLNIPNRSEYARIQLVKNGNPTELQLQISYCGAAWTDWTETNGVREIYMTPYTTCFIRNASATSTGFSTSLDDYYQFRDDIGTADVIAGGDFRSLQCKNIASAVNSRYCFAYLFRDFTNLVEIPPLKALSGYQYCYYYMFFNTGISEAEIWQPTVYNYGARSMFHNCANLTKVTVKWTSSSGGYAHTNWLRGVAAHGEVYCYPELELDSNSESGVPTGWTRVDLQ